MRKLFYWAQRMRKTSLTQAMRGETVTYHKTQYVNTFDVIIDTPVNMPKRTAWAVRWRPYSYEADVVGLLLSAIEPYSLYPPSVTVLANREVIGIVTKIDHRLANPKRAAEWLKLAGCRKIFTLVPIAAKGFRNCWNTCARKGT